MRSCVFAEVLSRFEADLAYLAATELHPALRGSTEAIAAAAFGSASSSAGAAQATQGPAAASLLHLVNAPALREAAAAAARGHQHFAGKVAELEALFYMLKADVEALLMQAGGDGSCVVVAVVCVLGGCDAEESLMVHLV